MALPFFSPKIEVFTTSDLTPILSRSSLSSIVELLSAFESGVEQVKIRSSTYESKLLSSFGVQFVERSLPDGFGEIVEGGVDMGHAKKRSSTMPASAAFGSPVVNTNVGGATSEMEKDELFLETKSNEIKIKIENWVQSQSELQVKLRQPSSKSSQEIGNQEEGWKGKSIQELSPWFSEFSSQVLSRREIIKSETFAWPVACLLVLSTSHPDPLGALATLWDLTSKDNLFKASSYSPKSGIEEDRQEWINPEVLRYIVLVHDFGAGGGRDGLEDAEKLHDKIRKTYGLHTALLPLFSASPTAEKVLPRADNVDSLWKPTITTSSPASTGLGLDMKIVKDDALVDGPIDAQTKGADLSEEDLKTLRVFMREMVVQSLIPFMERAVVVGNEQFIASKRSIGGRLFSAGRKYFGSSTTTSRDGTPVPSGASSPLGFNSTRGFYPFTSQESQSRRLADLAFMIGDYKLASQVYDQISKDSKNDRAWRYYSSALRMVGLCQLLLHPTATPLTFNPDVWLEQASQIPLSVQVVDLNELQAILLYYDLYQKIGDWRPAPMGLIRAAGVMDEFSSALLLEQAAIADLHLPRPSRRKYAFHMAMAAARYEKCGYKSLSRRSLSQAVSIYRADSKERGWDAIRSHCFRGLGRQAHNAGKSEEAVEYFLELPVGDVNELHLSETQEEESWLKDFGMAWEHLGPNAADLVASKGIKLKTSIFDVQGASLRSEVLPIDEDSWIVLEKELLTNGFVKESRPKSLNRPIGSETIVVGETFYLNLRAINPLNASLALGGLIIETDAKTGTVIIEAPSEIELAPRESILLQIPVTTSSLESFTFTSLSYRFNDLLPCKELLTGKPKRLTQTRAQLSTPTYSTFNALLVQPTSPTPVLSITFVGLKEEMSDGETIAAFVEVKNVGSVAAQGLKFICSDPAILGIRNGEEIYKEGDGATEVKMTNRIAFNPVHKIELPGGGLKTGESMKIPISFRAVQIGFHTIRLLFVFSESDSEKLLSARISKELLVTPLVGISQSLRSSILSERSHTLGLEISNLSYTSPLAITQITSLSRYYRVVASGKPLTPLASIEIQQSSNLFISIEPVPTSDLNDDSAEYVVKKLNLLLQGKEVQGEFLGETNLLTASIGSNVSILDPLLTTITSTLTLARQISLVSQLSTLPSALHPHLFPLHSTDSITIIIFYTTPNLSGHLISSIPIAPSKNILKTVLELGEKKAGGIYAETQREKSALLEGLRKSEWGLDECPGIASMKIQEIVEHSFEKGPCMLPISFSIRNLSSRPLHYTLSLLPSSVRSTSVPVFAGKMQYSGNIDSLASVVQIETKLWISRVGSYDIGSRWQVEFSSVGAGQEKEVIRWIKAGDRSLVRVGNSVFTKAVEKIGLVEVAV